MSNAFRIKERNGGRDEERERKTRIKQGGGDRENNCNKAKDGEMSAQKVRGFSGREWGGGRQGKIEGD